MKAFLILSALVGLISADQALYDNYQVHNLIPKNEEQINLLKNLEINGYNFWSDIQGVGKPVQIMVAPHQRSQFKEAIENADLEHELYIEDVQTLIDNERPTSQARAKYFDFTDYYEIEQIYEYMEDLAKQYDNVEIVKGGVSYEKRDILGVHIKNGHKNRTVFLEGGIHAREWIAPATTMYILTQLLTSNDPAVKAVYQNHDWYVFPVFNPDGYKYTFHGDRLWRKTRKPYGVCHGADPNRNWGYNWMEGGASMLPCSDTHAGSSAFSEIETKSMSQFITQLSDDLVAYIGFHAYSQLLLIPYGHSSAHVENYSQLERIGRKAANKLKQRHGTRYTVGNIVEVIYVASGASMDWVKGTFHTPITYTYELRDTGRYGFLLPAKQIIPTGEETLDSLVVILQEAQKEIP